MPVTANPRFRSFVVAFGLGGVALGVLAAFLAHERNAEPDARPATKAAVGRSSEATPVRGGETGPGLHTIVVKTRAPGDPRSDDYDPVIRSREGNLGALEVFEAEPRNDAWAAEFEHKIEAQLTSDLASVSPEVQIEDLQCRTSSCRIVLRREGPKELARVMGHRFPVGIMGNLTAITSIVPENEGTTVTWVVLIGRDQRDPAAYDDWYASTREEFLRQVREDENGQLPNGVPFPNH